jgi:hypothetical protein
MELIEVFIVSFIRNIHTDTWQREEIKCRSLSYARAIASDINRNPMVRDVHISKSMERNFF